MLSTWLPRFLVPIAIALAFALFRRMAPPSARMTEHRYDESQIPEPLPPGVIGGAMWSVGMALAMLFFVLRGANHLWASWEGPSLLTQYPPQVLWCFLPGFAALSIPWPLTVWYLRRVGRWEEADSIQDASDSKGGFNSFRVMKWFSIGVVGPIAIFTLLAVPIHFSITGSEVRVGHYASFRPEIFPLNDATRLTIVDVQKVRGGHSHETKDLTVDFADGRRLRSSQVGDGGTSVQNDVIQLLILKTGLTPQHSSTAE
jgi:hypothetical protein